MTKIKPCAPQGHAEKRAAGSSQAAKADALNDNANKRHKRTRRERSDFDVAVGFRLRVIRQKHKISMKALGEQLGLSYSRINQFERGFDRISNERLYRLALLFNVPVGYFFGESEHFPDQSPPYTRRTLAIATEIENTPSTEIRNALYRFIKTTNKALEDAKSKTNHS